MAQAQPANPNFDEYLTRALGEVTTNPLAIQFIRRLAHEYPEQFEAAAVNYLTGAGGREKQRLIGAILIRQPGFVDSLADADKWPCDLAVSLTRSLLDIDAGFDMELVRRLPSRTPVRGVPALKGASAARLIHILDQTSRGARLVPVLAHLLGSDDIAVAESAASFIGRRVHMPNLIGQRVHRPDLTARLLHHGEDRVRANAVESLWGVQSGDAQEVFTASLNDQSNRVVGNSLLGLALAGDREIGDHIQTMAKRSEPGFRATAAWVIGRTLNAKLLPVLSELSADPDEMVQKAAKSALAAFDASVHEDTPIIEPDVAAESRTESTALA